VIYSIWNQGKRLYDYYETSEVQERANVGSPKHLKVSRSTDYGMTVPQSGWRMPKNAQYRGSGDSAKGRVAALGGIDFGVSRNTVGLIGLGLVAFILWKKKVLA